MVNNLFSLQGVDPTSIFVLFHLMCQISRDWPCDNLRVMRR